MSAVLTASDRLALSRQRLRQAMLDIATPASTPRHGVSALAWLDSLKDIPGAHVVIEAVSTWWAQHPLRVAAVVAGNGVNAVVRPMAQRHPAGLILGALIFGAMFAWSRPWRWILTPALFAGLLPQLFSKALANVPAGSWMSLLSTLTPDRQRPAPPPQDPIRQPAAAQQAPLHAAHMSAS